MNGLHYLVNLFTTVIREETWSRDTVHRNIVEGSPLLLMKGMWTLTLPRQLTDFLTYTTVFVLTRSKPGSEVLRNTWKWDTVPVRSDDFLLSVTPVPVTRSTGAGPGSLHHFGSVLVVSRWVGCRLISVYSLGSSVVFWVGQLGSWVLIIILH